MLCCMNQRSCPRPPQSLNIVGPILRNFREEKGLSQLALTELLQRRGWDVDRVVITRIETGTRMVTDYEIAFILDVLEVSWMKLAPLLDKQAKQRST